MQITAIKTTPVSIAFASPERWAFGEHTGMTSLIVEIETDAGITGIGEIVPGGPGPRALMAAVDEVAPLMIGMDARDINANIGRMLYPGGWYMFTRTGNLLMAGLEMAMWDILGKSLDQPLYRLFGGPVRERVFYVYYLQARTSISEMVEEAVEAVSRGFSTIFFKGGWDNERDISLVASLRERIRLPINLRLDANEAWTIGTATRMLKRLEPFDLEFVEQPVRMDDLDAFLRLRQVTSVPIGANQSGWTSARIFELAKHKAADVIVTDPHQEGGLSGLRRVIGICDAAGLPVAHHAFSGLTIAMTAAQHVYATSPNCILAGQAYAPGFVTGDVTTTMFSPEGGGAELPTLPGIGVELDHARLAAAERAYNTQEVHSFFDRGQDLEWMPSQ